MIFLHFGGRNKYLSAILMWKPNHSFDPPHIQIQWMRLKVSWTRKTELKRFPTWKVTENISRKSSTRMLGYPIPYHGSWSFSLLKCRQLRVNPSFLYKTTIFQVLYLQLPITYPGNISPLYISIIYFHFTLVIENNDVKSPFLRGKSSRHMPWLPKLRELTAWHIPTYQGFKSQKQRYVSPLSISPLYIAIINSHCCIPIRLVSSSFRLCSHYIPIVYNPIVNRVWHYIPITSITWTWFRIIIPFYPHYIRIVAPISHYIPEYFISPIFRERDKESHNIIYIYILNI